MSEKPRILGIDLGTTNTCVASVRNKIPKVVPTDRGNLTLPSVVAYTAKNEWLVGAVVCATLVQGLTSFSLTQLVSKEGQRAITELRRKVQAHIGKLPLSYYDANKTGALVSRIMTDVEGVRNLIGTGLVEFCGGLLGFARGQIGQPANIGEGKRPCKIVRA